MSRVSKDTQHKILAIYRMAFGENIPNPLRDVESRITLQKIIYLAQKALGIELGIKFNTYQHGPYSSELPQIYLVPYFPEKVKGIKIPEELIEFQEPLQELASKDTRWLELIATYYDVKNPRCYEDAQAITTVSRMKSIPIEKMWKIVREATKILRKRRITAKAHNR